MKRINLTKNYVSLIGMLGVVVLVVSNVSCGGGASSTPPPTIRVSVSPGTTTVQVGSSQQFTATVNSSNAAVTWTLTQGGMPCAPGCGTVSPTSTPSGTPTTYTAPSPVPVNTRVTLTATSSADTPGSGSATISIGPLSGISVFIAGSSLANVQARGTAQFAAIVNNDPTNRGVTWSVSCSPAPCGSVSPLSTPSGTPTTYTAPPTPPSTDLRVDVTATSVTDPSQSALAIVNVLAVRASIAPGGALLPAHLSQQFTASLAYDPTNKGVTWTLTQGRTACSPTCGSVAPSSTASGSPTTYTAPATVPTSPTVTLTATSVEDTTKSASDAITISAGTVELIPNILDFGTVVVNHRSSPQATKLTNTGNSALSIANISIAGTNATDFSQSNTCATSAGAGNSCTITVTFKPTATGLRGAIMSISDSTAGSPQQVSLSGTGHTRGDALNESAVHSALAQASTAAVPFPGGPDKVGTRVMDLVDAAREDPYLAKGTKRELLVRFWYPASLNEACKPAEYASSKVWNHFSQLVGVPLPDVLTNSCWNSPVAEGPHPVVVFTPGYTATFTDYTFILEDLASRGYVVASVDHTFEATAVEFPDGRFVESLLGSHLGTTWRGDDQTLSFATSVRLQDLKFVVTELGRLNVQADSPFAGKLDTSRVAVAGHSMGGATAFLGMEQDARFRAAIIIDGFVPGALIKPTETPILILAAGRDKWSSDECRLWDSLRGPRLAVNLSGTEHVTPSDAVWLAQYAIKTGPMGPDKTIAAVRDYIASFLDASLRERQFNPLLTGPSSDYPGAEVTMENERLSGCPIKPQ